MKRGTPYDQKYSGSIFYWGKTPSVMCDRVIDTMKPDPTRQPRLLDLGCGEGRNAVYFAQHDFEVIGLDLSQKGLEKTRSYAKEMGLHIATIHADIVTHKFHETYDVIFSTGALHYLPPEMRHQRFKDFKVCTSPDGIHAFSVFVEKPFISRAPDAEDTAYMFASGELMSYYWDWEILYCNEEIFDCMSSGVPHKHAVNRIIAKRYQSYK
jgi:tellurite methyltransferase